MRDKEIFGEVLDSAKLNTHAGELMASPDPFKPVILSILFEQQKEINQLRKKLENIEKQQGL